MASLPQSVAGPTAFGLDSAAGRLHLARSSVHGNFAHPRNPPGKFVSVREYLATSYRPDCENVDGRVEMRNLGEYDHGLLQIILGQLFMNHREDWKISTTVVDRNRAEAKLAFDRGGTWLGIDVVFATGTHAADVQGRAIRATAFR
jgi:hypothetical protein